MNISGINKYIYENKYIVYCTIISFILSYIFLFINLSFNSDSVITYFSGIESNISSNISFANGRWARGFFENFLSWINYNNIVPFFGFILLSFVSCLFFLSLKKFLNIKNNFLYCLLIFSLFSTPSFVESFSYYQDNFSHVIAVFLIAVLFYVIESNVSKIIPSIIFAIIIAEYQSYFCFVSSIFVIKIIYILISKYKYNTMDIKIYAIIKKFALTIVLSLIIYFFLNIFICNTMQLNSQLSTRFGTGFVLGNVIRSFFKCYGMVLVLPFFTYAGMNTTIVIKIIFFIIFVFIIMSSIIYLVKTSFINKICFLFLMFVLPIFMNGIAFLAGTTTIRMTQGLSTIFILFLVFADNYFCDQYVQLKHINIKKVICIIFLIISVHYIYYANGFAYHSYIISNATKTFSQQLVNMIKNCPDYSSKRKIYFAGKVNTTNLLDYYCYYDSNIFVTAMPENNSLLFPWGFKGTINRYAAFDYCEADDNDIKKILNTDDYVNMPIYPDYGSVKCIDEIIVVKFQ